MKIWQLYEQEPQEMGEPETTEQPQVDPNQGRITSLEEFKAAVSDETIQKVILYFNRRSFENLSLEQIRQNVAPILRRLGSASPYSVFSTYVGNAGTYGRIRFPGWTRSWHQLANYFNIVAAKYDKNPINIAPGVDQEEMDNLSPEQKASLINDNVIGLNNAGIVLRTILSISSNEEWEAVKEAFKRFVISSQNQLIPRLQAELGTTDKQRIDQHLESIGSEDRLLDYTERARMNDYDLTPSGYTEDQELTTEEEVQDYLRATIGQGVYTDDFIDFLSLEPGRVRARDRIVFENIVDKFREDGKVTVAYCNERIAILLDAFYPAYATTID